MAKLKKFRAAITLLLIFLTSAVYAAAMNEIAHSVTDLTVPLIFNGVAPSLIIGYFIKKHLDKNEVDHKELIDTKNDHASRITEVETHIEDCPNCPGVKK